MKYKIGFFYNTPHYHSLYYTFESDHFEFKLSSLSYEGNHPHQYSNMGYYSFDYPVIYEEDDMGRMVNARLLSSIPVHEQHTLTGKGFEILIPPRNGDTPKVFLDGTCLIEGNDTEDKTTIFNNTVLFYFSIQFYSLAVKNPVLPEDKLKACIAAMKEIRLYLNNLDLYKELDSLSVRVYGHLRCKIGDDDTYSVYRIADSSSEVIRKDSYLSSLIGIGEQCIWRESAYSGHLESDAWKYLSEEGYLRGTYDNEMLEKEKNRIIKLYSEDTHIGHLLYDRYQENQRKTHFAYTWDSKLNDFKRILYQGFNFDRIEGNIKLQKMTYPLGSSGYKTVSSDTQESVLKEINTYLFTLTLVK